MKGLNSTIVNFLSKKLDKRASTIKKDIYLLTGKYPSLTKNALAQIYAMENNTSVLRHLDAEDRSSLPNLVIDQPIALRRKDWGKGRQKRRVLTFLRTASSEFYKVDHVAEINRAYTFGCYTACFLLCRKVVENLVIDVLRSRYPPHVPGHLGLYYDVSQRRYLDFGILLKNFSDRSAEFGPDSKMIERIVALASPFKKEANDRAHSWYYIVKHRDELDRMDVQDIIDLLEQLLRSNTAS